jgi:hypothetical protein
VQGIQQIPAIVDWAIHSGETVAIVGAAIAVIKKFGRDETIKKNYPPHRHIQDTIIYPKEYQPAKTEELHDN